jgi:2-polyprenyl-3-methyl-5-hydroxy-6-metoxy-1,4-benzoquinol methylase
MYRLVRGMTGRAYEAALAINLVEYRRPFQYYNDEVWDRGYAKGEHDHYEGVPDRSRYGAIAGYLGAVPGKLDILDIGCGTGVMRERIPDQIVGSYTGVDTAPSALAKARTRGFSDSVFLENTPRRQFDAVIANDMLYLVPEIGSFLDHLKQLVRPGGLFVTSNTRYHGDFKLREWIEERFTLVDETIVVNPRHKRKWRVGCYIKGE